MPEKTWVSNDEAAGEMSKSSQDGRSNELLLLEHSLSTPRGLLSAEAENKMLAPARKFTCEPGGKRLYWQLLHSSSVAVPCQ